MTVRGRLVKLECKLGRGSIYRHVQLETPNLRRLASESASDPNHYLCLNWQAMTQSQCADYMRDWNRKMNELFAKRDEEL